MAKSSRGLSQQNGVYYARKGVPPEARPILGKTEIHRTLDTRDEGKALDALPDAMEKLDDLVEVAKTFSNAIGTTDLGAPSRS